MIKDLKKLSPFGRWRHGVVVNDVIQQLKQSVVRDVVPLLLILSTRHTFTEGHRCARHTATSLLTSHIDIDDMLTICFDISDKNKTTNLLTALPPGQPGFHQVNPGSSRSTRVPPGQPWWAGTRSVENSHHQLSPLSSSLRDCLPLISFLRFYGLVHQTHANAISLSRCQQLLTVFYGHCRHHCAGMQL